ncbi:MAG: alpha/beta fold hydrolase [Moraxella sp.]|nr:alpha/beta fold hydrolase [Moraxella sp.]
MTTTKPLTLLIHGLHMNGLYMRPLAKKLSHAGFNTHAPSYHSLTKSIDAHSAMLHDWLSRHHDGSPINLVGHSLGGLVIRHFLANFSEHSVHRCVTLGTPHQGSICSTYTNRLLPPLVRKAHFGALDGTCPALSDGISMGVIAGTKSIGLGLPLLHYHSKKHRLSPDEHQNDGTVYLSETPLVGASDYLVMPVSHTGFLTDNQVAHQVRHFLEHGRFYRT